ncbi:MAG TPA: ion channel [Trichocoleus sp.]
MAENQPIHQNGLGESKLGTKVPFLLPKQRSRLVGRRGQFNVVQVGKSRSQGSDLYHALLTLSWPRFLCLMALFYSLLNALFALAYLFDPSGNGIANAPPGSFVDAFFFSVQTMASIGYGALYPQTTYANVLVTIESLLGLLWIATATGLMFARFSRPTAKVMFSRMAIVAPYDGLPTLMFRAANQRRNQILEAHIRVTLVRNVQTQEGIEMRRFYDMALARSQNPIFALTWTALHPITPESPLYGMTSADLEEQDAEIIVTLMGLDETFSQTIHARYSYAPCEICWNMQFADILSYTPDGRRAVDYRQFHKVLPL